MKLHFPFQPAVTWRKIRLSICLMAVLLSLLPAAFSHAALREKGAVTVQELCNPYPAPDDVIIPLPANLTMAFRVVAVPATTLLSDMTLRPGTDSASVDRAFYDRSYLSALSAPLSDADVPAQWKKGLHGKHFYYLIAKYEVSRAQWNAVMGTVNQGQWTPDDAKPITDISWFDALQFTERWTQWLYANAPASLPKFKNEQKLHCFVRLPTEAEWEYAARGGQAVPVRSLKQDEFFPLAEGTRRSDYAVYRPADTTHAAETLARIGSRRPNPLGLYDTSGNAAEMTADFFRFSVGGRLLGSAGGFVRKGGSYLSEEAEVLPGRREEFPFYQDTGAGHASDMGFRPVITGINTPSATRVHLLQEEYARAGQSIGQTPAAKKDAPADKAAPAAPAVPPRQAAATPIEELDRIIQETKDPKILKNLTALRNTIKDASILREREQQARTLSVLKECLYAIESAHNYAFRKQTVEKTIRSQYERLLAEAPTQEMKDEIRARSKAITQLSNQLEGAITSTLDDYRTNLEELSGMSPSAIVEGLQTLADENNANDFLSTRIAKNLTTLASHCRQALKGRVPSKKTIYQDIFPTMK